MAAGNEQAVEALDLVPPAKAPVPADYHAYALTAAQDSWPVTIRFLLLQPWFWPKAVTTATGIASFAVGVGLKVLL